MTKRTLAQRLNFFNPWWASGTVSDTLTPKFQRHVFSKIESYLKYDRVVVLKGPRRTGKTTIFFQLIAKLMQTTKAQPTDFLYLSFDDPLLRVDLFELLKLYESTTGRPLDSGPVKYIFLDEVQFLPEWAAMVKVFYDKKFPIKFFVSGSAASLLVKQSESLAGRTIEETILPLTFSEWLEYNNAFTTPFSNKEETLFGEYIKHSGFLHVFDIKEKEIWTKMLLEDVVTKALYKDSVEIFGLRDPAVLTKLFSYLAESTSGLVNESKLASMLAVERIQINKYLSFLENTLLVFPLAKYSQHLKESLRSQKKYHLTDQGFNQIYFCSGGAAVESIVARHLWEKYPRQVYYWREREEVDIVLEREKILLPIEIKTSEDVGKTDLKGLISFAKKFKQKEGIVLYFGERKEVKIGDLEIRFMPVWEYLKSL